MFCQEPGENHHESDDDEGVEESVPGGQLYHGSACQVSSITNKPKHHVTSQLCEIMTFQFSGFQFQFTCFNFILAVQIVIALT